MASERGTTLILDHATVTGPGAHAMVPGPDRTFQAVGETTAGAGAATIVIQGSNMPSPAETDWLDIATITLTLGTTRTTDGFASAAPWYHIRANVTAISGTGATVSVAVGA